MIHENKSPLAYEQALSSWQRKRFEGNDASAEVFSVRGLATLVARVVAPEALTLPAKREPARRLNHHWP